MGQRWQAWGRAIAEIDEGSQPTATYYVLLGLSELIAGFAADKEA